MEENNNSQGTDAQGQTAAPQPTQGDQLAQAPQLAPQAPAQPAVTSQQQEALSNAPDRTREQFEKLLESNKRLYDANMLLRQEMEQQRTAPKPQPNRPATQEVDLNDFIQEDPSTGQKYINDQRLKARLAEIQERAEKAEQAIQNYVKTNEDREIERQNKEAFTAYPELEPGNKTFDVTFHKQVRGILADSMFNPDDYQGRPLSFKEAADFVRAQYPKQAAQQTAPATAEIEQQTAAKSQAAQAQKEQASSQANSQPRAAQQISDEDELESLRYRTRYQNDDWALAERIKYTEHILPRDAEQQ